VNDADAALLRERDRERRFRHGVHRGGAQRNLQADVARELGGGVGLVRENVRTCWD
jgi:hypothetical protein